MQSSLGNVAIIEHNRLIMRLSNEILWRTETKDERSRSSSSQTFTLPEDYTAASRFLSPIAMHEPAASEMQMRADNSRRQIAAPAARGCPMVSRFKSKVLTYVDFNLIKNKFTMKLKKKLNLQFTMKFI